MHVLYMYTHSDSFANRRLNGESALVLSPCPPKRYAHAHCSSHFFCSHTAVIFTRNWGQWKYSSLGDLNVTSKPSEFRRHCTTREYRSHCECDCSCVCAFETGSSLVFYVPLGCYHLPIIVSLACKSVFPPSAFPWCLSECVCVLAQVSDCESHWSNAVSSPLTSLFNN